MGIRRVVSGVVAAAWIAGNSSASAQPAAPGGPSNGAGRAPDTTVSVSTPDYTVIGSSATLCVIFGDDDLAGDPLDPYGGVIRPPPTVMRQGLLRPRLHFVPELLKSVEDL